MSRWHYSVLIVLIVTVIARADETSPSPYVPTSPAAVNELKIDWHDAARKRDVPVKFYFPKEGPGPFPIIVFSHGLGGNRDGYAYLGRHWAGCGYVCVHLQHLGSDDAVWKDVPLLERPKVLRLAAADWRNATDRVRDVKFVMDEVSKLNDDSRHPLKGRLDIGTIGVAGHSFGGHTSLAVAGQSFLGRFNSEAPQIDPRLKAAIQMSAPVPRIRQNLDAVYEQIQIPVMHLTGTEDFSELAPHTTPEDRRLPYDHMHHSATCLVIFKAGDHLIFSGRPRLANPGKLKHDVEFQKLICAGTTAFWDACLKSNAAARPWLLKGGYSEILGQNGTLESKSPMPDR